MQQPSNPVPVNSFSSSKAVIVDNASRLTALCSQARDAPCKMPRKKELLTKACALKKDILTICKSFDTAFGNANLEEAMNIAIPKKESIRNPKSSNQELAKMMLEMKDKVTLLHQHMGEQLDEIQAVRRQTRQGNRSSNSSFDAVFEFLEDFKSVMDTVETHALSIQNECGSIKGPTLSNMQRQRTFDQNRVPADPTLQICPFCQHKSINSVLENDSLASEMAKQEKNYRLKIEVWEAYENAKAKTKPGRTINYPKDPLDRSKVLKRKPIRGNVKQPVHMCMCATSMCIMRNSNTSSTCFIGCEDTKCNQRYPFPTGGVCQCPVCQCKCQGAFTPDQHAVILHESTNPVKSNADAVQTPAQARENIQNFLGRSMKSAITSAMSVITHESSAKLKSSSDADLIDYGTRISNEACALNIARFGGEQLNMQDKQILRKQLGKPTTEVILPGGAAFDTRQIRGNNQHSRNNNLSNAASEHTTSTFAKGMKSNLEIDYSQLSDEWKEANNTLRGALQYSNEIICLDDEDESNIVFGTAVTPHVPKRPVDMIQRKNDAAVEMHDRMLNRYAMSTDEKLEKYTNDPTEENKQSYLKVRKVSRSLRNETNPVSAVLEITANGKKLIESPRMNSQQACQRYALVHELDEE